MLAKKLFAPNFMPVFKASELAKFCNIITRREKNEINFVLKFEPFYKFKSKIIKATKRKTTFNSSFEERQKIKSEWKNEFLENETKTEFDDKKIFNKIVGSSITDNPIDQSSAFEYLKEKFQKDQHEKSLMLNIR